MTNKQQLPIREDKARESDTEVTPHRGHFYFSTRGEEPQSWGAPPPSDRHSSGDTEDKVNLFKSRVVAIGPRGQSAPRYSDALERRQVTNNGGDTEDTAAVGKNRPGALRFSHGAALSADPGHQSATHSDSGRPRSSSGRRVIVLHDGQIAPR